MHDVFISYAKANGNVADAICHALERRGVRCWYAPRNIEPGKSWSAAIIDGIDGARVMVVVLSQHSNGSVHVRNEIERAVHRGRIIVPVRIENVEPSKDLELFLSSHHWLDAMTPPIESHLESLADTITQHLGNEGDGRPAPPPPSPPRQVSSAPKKERSGAGKLMLVASLLIALAAGGYWAYNNLYAKGGETVTAAELVPLRAAAQETAEKIDNSAHANNDIVARWRVRASSALTEAKRLEGLREFAAAKAELERATRAAQDATRAAAALDDRPNVPAPVSKHASVADEHAAIEQIVADGDGKLTDGDVSGARECFGAAAARLAALVALDLAAQEAAARLEKTDNLLADPAFEELPLEKPWAKHWKAERERAREAAKAARAAYDAGAFDDVSGKCEEADKHARAYLEGGGKAWQLARRLEAIDLDWEEPIFGEVTERRELCRTALKQLWIGLAAGAHPEEDVTELESIAKDIGKQHRRARAAAVGALDAFADKSSAEYAEAKDAFARGYFGKVTELAETAGAGSSAKSRFAAAEEKVNGLASPLAASAAKEALIARRGLEKALVAYREADYGAMDESLAVVNQAVADATRQHEIAVRQFQEAEARLANLARRLAGRRVKALHERATGEASALIQKGEYGEATKLYHAILKRAEAELRTPVKPEPAKPDPAKPTPDLQAQAKQRLSDAGARVRALPRPLAESARKSGAIAERQVKAALTAYHDRDYAAADRASAAAGQAAADALRRHKIAVGKYETEQLRYRNASARAKESVAKDAVFARGAAKAEDIARKGSFEEAAKIYASLTKRLATHKPVRPTPVKPVPVKPIPVKPVVIKPTLNTGDVYYGSFALRTTRLRSPSVPILLHLRGSKGNNWYATVVELGPPAVRSSLQGAWSGKSLTLKGKTRRGELILSLAPNGDVLEGSARRGKAAFRVRLRKEPRGVPNTSGRRYAGELGTGVKVSVAFSPSKLSRGSTNTGSAQGTMTITQGRERVRATFRGTLYGRYLLASWKRTDNPKARTWTEGSFWVRVDDRQLYGRWASGRQKGTLKGASSKR